MDRTQAEGLAAATDEARRRARLLLSVFWLPLILFGALTVASAAVTEVAPGPAVGLLWAIGAPLATIATALWYRGRTVELGIGDDPRPYVLTAVGILVTAFALGAIGRGSVTSYAGPLLMVGLGYLVFARLQRSLALTIAAGVTIALAAGLFLYHPSHAYAVVAATLGVGAVLLGIANRLQVRRE